MASRLALFCKSFRDDFGRLAQLVASVGKFAAGYPFVLSIPRADLALLRESVGPIPKGVHLIFDEDYVPPESERLGGWLQQQVCKLSLHRVDLADSYLAIDSDSYLIAPIAESDFLEGERKRVIYSSVFTGYSQHNDKLIAFLTESDADHSETIAKSTPCQVPRGTVAGFDDRLAQYAGWLDKHPGATPMDRIPWINTLFQIPPRTAMQPGQILHATLLAEMERFFAARKISLSRLIELCPWEYNWYASWASSTQGDTIAPSISPILHFAEQKAVDFARTQGLTTETLARRFKIIQMAARHFDETRF